jgi:hypothetical protein
MALLLNYNLNGDLTLTNAYLRISKMRVIYDPTKATELGGTKWICFIGLEVRTAKNKNVQTIWEDERWVFALQTGTNPLTQAYTYLKSLPEFAGAIDDND